MAATRAESFRQHADHCEIFVVRQLRVRVRATQYTEQFVFGPFAGRHFGHDLLRQHVERLGRDRDAVQLAAPHGVEQRCTFDQLIA